MCFPCWFPVWKLNLGLEEVEDHHFVFDIAAVVDADWFGCGDSFDVLDHDHCSFLVLGFEWGVLVELDATAFCFFASDFEEFFQDLGNTRSCGHDAEAVEAISLCCDQGHVSTFLVFRPLGFWGSRPAHPRCRASSLRWGWGFRSGNSCLLKLF